MPHKELKLNDQRLSWLTLDKELTWWILSLLIGFSYAR